uniref:tRNA-intron lyase n=1 Tax=Proboscia inermis TaxID=420281 RepID=A0A7S0C490_9STRA|mmetsp:Transcript_26183/g.26573  ORF Transcript_26183/g.26573 Transcript_26183/m.26573 type:complete len:152 (+) Transcript_26183:53-508(+)
MNKVENTENINSMDKKENKDNAENLKKDKSNKRKSNSSTVNIDSSSTCHVDCQLRSAPVSINEDKSVDLSAARRIEIVREYFERKGYRVHSGLQFGAELTLYADSPGRVHSDFCVHVVPPGEFYVARGRMLHVTQNSYNRLFVVNKKTLNV